MADPDLELRGAGLDLLAMAAIFPSVISSFFTQNKGGGGAALGPSPRSSTGTCIIQNYNCLTIVIHVLQTV